jgi:hypothetical protein
MTCGAEVQEKSMRTLPVLAATAVIGAGAFGFAPDAEAGHLFVGIGIGLPGIAVVAPAPLFLARPYYYYGPGYYPYPYAGLPAVAVGGFYGRPYLNYRGHRGYAGGWHGRR